MRAKITFSDGIECKISAETEKEFREKLGPKPKEFNKKIQFCHLGIEVSPTDSCVLLSWEGKNCNYCAEPPYKIREIIIALQSAIDFIENK